MNKLLVEKYRPISVDQYVFPNNDIREYVEQIVSSGNLPNLLLSGIQGTGKTSLIQVLIHELKLNKFDVKFCSSSKETNVDFIRDVIDMFARTYPSGDMRVVVFEEADKLSSHAQTALLSLIEETASTCRFMFSTNHPHKIIPALQSRLQHTKIDALDMDAVFEKVVAIIEAEEIEITDLAILEGHVETFYPDLRKIINSIDQASRSGALKPVMDNLASDEVTEQWNVIWKNKPNRAALEALVHLVDTDNYEQLYVIAYENVSKLPGDIRDVAYDAIRDALVDAPMVGYQPILMRSTLIRMFAGV